MSDAKLVTRREFILLFPSLSTLPLSLIMDDDDDFLYGGAGAGPTIVQPTTTSVPTPISISDIQHAQDALRQLEDTANAGGTPASTATASGPGKSVTPQADDDEDPDSRSPDQGQEDDEDEDADDDDDDIEIIMEPVSRSLDLRGQQARTKSGRPVVPPPTQPGDPTTATPSQTQPPVQPSLTTEYNPIQRGAPAASTDASRPTHLPPSTAVTAGASSSTTPAPTSSQATPAPNAQPSSKDTQAVPQPQQSQPQDDAIDTSKLPPATAPPSHPSIDFDGTGVYDGQSILDLDLNALADKPWRKPGSDISDWFNYGFDEISWEAYCYRRRDLGDVGNVLKSNVLAFAGFTEDQLVAVPPEVRTMVMTGANVLMNNANNAGQGMMGPGVMMDMMPMGMGMNNDMAMMQGMMPDGQTGQPGGVGVGVGQNGAQDQGMMQDGFNPNAVGGGMMNMGMGNEYAMQEQPQMVQQMYPVMQEQNVPNVPAGRGAPVPPYPRGRGAPPPRGGRGGNFPGRGRGRGMYGGDGAPPTAPARPASPLPPNVPTGPRNQNKYKDRDNNAPAVDGLDYGGGKDGGIGRRTPTVEPDERGSSRKRRMSPGLDDIRGSKRR